MWTVISVCFIVIISLVGVTELLRKFWLFLMRPKEDPPRVMVVFLKEGIAVQQLRFSAEYLSWENGKTFCAVAAVDTGLSEESRRDVEKIVNSRSDMIFGDAALIDCINSFAAVNFLKEK